MSDLELEAQASRRPGKNAGVTVSHTATAHGKRTKKRPNHRSKGQNAKVAGGIQADRDADAAHNKGVDPSAHSDHKEPSRQNLAEKDQANTPKNNRRNRRHRWKKRQKVKSPETTEANAANSVVASDADIQRSVVSPGAKSVHNGQASNHDGGKRRKNRRKTRRDKKAKTDEAGVLPDASRAETAQQEGHSSNNNSSAQKPQRGKRGANQRQADAYAALDLGTNNCRLLVAVPQQPGRFRVVDAFSRIVRLGEGLAASGRLSDEAMDRAVDALKSCADKLHNRRVRNVRLIATEACRRAVNGGDFLQRVEKEAGLKLTIVDRETEARLAVAGCASLVDRRAKGVVLFDIGGGSSELALLDLRKRKKYDLAPAMVSWTSLPHGVVTLSEKHGGGKLVTRKVFDEMVEDVSQLLDAYEGRDALEEAARDGEVHLLGTSGTVTTLAGIHLKLPRYDRRRVDGTWMASKDVDAMVDALVDMSFEERIANPCIGRDRADLVLAGCAILVAIQRLWPCPRLRVADRGLREGLLTEMMNADNAWQRRPRPFRGKQSGSKNKRNNQSAKSNG